MRFNTTSKHLRNIITLILLGCLPQSIEGIGLSWVGGQPDNDMLNQNNWNPNINPNGNSLIFDTFSVTFTPFLASGANLNPLSIDFSTFSSAYTVTINGTLTMTNNIRNDSITATQEFDITAIAPNPASIIFGTGSPAQGPKPILYILTGASPTVLSTMQFTGSSATIGGSTNLSLGAHSQLELTGNNLTLTIPDLQSTSSTGNINLGASTNLLRFGTSNVSYSIDGSISGSGSIQKNGTGTTTFLGSNSYSGTTTIFNGTLVAGANNSLQSTAIVMDNNTTLSTGTGTTNTITGLNSTFTTASVVLGDGSNLRIGGTSTFDGVISDAPSSHGKITVLGNLTLTNTNTYTGGTEIDSGTLFLTGTGSISPSGYLDLEGGNFDISGLTGINPTSTIEYLTGGAGTIFLGSSELITGTTYPAPTTFFGKITGSGNFMITGDGTLNLGGSSNDYSGTTIIGSPSLTDHPTLAATGASGTFSPNSIVDINSGTLESFFLNETIAGLNSTNTSAVVDFGLHPYSPNVLSISGNNVSSYAGKITGFSTLQVINSQQLTLTGNHNDYTQGTIIATGGTIFLTGVGSLPTNRNLTVNTTGTFDISGISGPSSQIGGLFGVGGLVKLGGKELIITGGGDFEGKITGTGGSIDLQAGDLILGGTSPTGSDYTGPTIIDGGTLESGGSSAFSQSSDFILNNSGVLKNPVNYVNSIQSLSSTSTFTSLNLGTGTSMLTIGVLGSLVTSSSFAGTINGSGTLIIDNGFNLTLTGVGSSSTGTGTIDIHNGTITAGAMNALPASHPFQIDANGILNLNSFNNTLSALNGAVNSQVHLGTGTLTVSGSTNSTFAGVIGNVSDSGGLTIDGGASLTLQGVNTYTGATTINDGILTLDATNSIANSTSVSLGANGELVSIAFNNDVNNLSGVTGSTVFIDNIFTVTENTPTTFAGVITGFGSLVKAGPQTLTLTGANNYTGGTTITAGALQGDTTSLQGSINVDGNTLIFNQATNGTFTGTLAGISSSTVEKIGSGTLFFSTSQSNYLGTTDVLAGTLNVNTTLGGDVIVFSGGTLSGNATIGNNLTILSGGNISPGNSIGTITVGNNYTQTVGANYLCEINAAGLADFITAGGVSSLAGNLFVLPIDGLRFAHNYHILHSNLGVNGQFTNVFFPATNSTLLQGEVIYDPNDVYIAFELNFTPFALTNNEIAVAAQINSILDPNADQSEIISALIGLTGTEIADALNAMSGEQYTYLAQMARYGNERLRNNVYNAVRNTLLPCWNTDPCLTIETWFIGQGGQGFAKGNDECAGMHNNNWDVTGGAHVAICPELIIGLAANYERDNLVFNLAGKTVRQSQQIAGYLVGKSKSSYIFAEASYGTTNGRFNRPIDFGTLSRIATSKPKSTQGLFYGEIGLTLREACLPSIFFQPFFGVEYGHYTINKITEHGAGSLDLTINKVNKISFDTLLGLHMLTTVFEKVDLSLDVAWQHRYDNDTIKIQNHFEDFGSEFTILGADLGHDGVKGNVQASYDINDMINLYADISGEWWGGWYSYSADIGIRAWW